MSTPLPSEGWRSGAGLEGDPHTGTQTFFNPMLHLGVRMEPDVEWANLSQQ